MKRKEKRKIHWNVSLRKDSSYNYLEDIIKSVGCWTWLYKRRSRKAKKKKKETKKCHDEREGRCLCDLKQTKPNKQAKYASFSFRSFDFGLASNFAFEQNVCLFTPRSSPNLFKAPSFFSFSSFL